MNEKQCEKIKMLVDVRVVADMSRVVSWHRSEEYRAEELARLANDFNEFIKDHRSQDHILLSVEKVFADVCSSCGSAWETMEADEPMFPGETQCASCGASVKQPEVKKEGAA